MISKIIDSLNGSITSKIKVLQSANCFKSFTEIINSKIVNKEVVLYIIFGVLTTLVNILSYLLFAKICGINNLISNIMAWFLSIIFAYVTNRIFVFESKNEKILHEFTLFITGRGLSGILDSLLFYVFVVVWMMDDVVSKIVISIIVIILNYVFNKLLVFKEE